MSACVYSDCNESVMARISWLNAMAGKPVQLIIRPPVDRPTGDLMCLHHAHVAMDHMLMTAMAGDR